MSDEIQAIKKAINDAGFRLDGPPSIYVFQTTVCIDSLEELLTVTPGLCP